MKPRCPHCQTTALNPDAETCWYCGREYVARVPRTRASTSQARPAPASVRGRAGTRRPGIPLES
jgi:hypothetical protein